MKVKELIELLSNYDPELQVILWDNGQTEDFIVLEKKDVIKMSMYRNQHGDYSEYIDPSGISVQEEVIAL